VLSGIVCPWKGLLDDLSGRPRVSSRTGHTYPASSPANLCWTPSGERPPDVAGLHLSPDQRVHVNRQVCAIRSRIFGEICPAATVTRTGPHDYVLCMLSTLLVIGGVLVGLLVLLAVIVSLSARPATAGTGRTRTTSWAADAGRPHPDAWSPMSSTTTSEIPVIR
jgi:hypothetical protein